MPRTYYHLIYLKIFQSILKDLHVQSNRNNSLEIALRHQALQYNL